MAEAPNPQELEVALDQPSLSEEQLRAYRAAFDVGALRGRDPHGEPDEPVIGYANPEKTREYAAKVYRSLGRFAHLPMTDQAVVSILERFPSWSYQVEEIGSNGDSTPARTFRRPITAGVKGFKLPVSEDPRREVSQTEDSITIEVPSVIGEDMRYVLRTESQFFPPKPQKDPGVTHSKYDELARAFNLTVGAKGKYLREGDVLTDKAAIALSLMTHFSSLEDMGVVLRASGSTLSRTLKLVQESLGLVEPGQKAHVDLMLAAIAIKVASIKHIPKDKTKNPALSETDIEILKKFYSPDPVERAEIRGRNKTEFLSQWSRLGDKLGPEAEGMQIYGRRLVVLYAVRDKLLRLPDPADIRAKLLANR